MKRKIVKKILSVVLAASMIFGNVGLPQELKEVHAVQTDIGSIISGKTLVTDSEIQNLYREMSYTPQGVHDPSIIKKDNEWYVFGSHRAVAKTDDLQNWQTVNMNGLFGDKDGTILTPDEAFVNSLYKGTIQTSKMAQTFMKNIKDDKTKETEETKTEQITVESEETSEIETESEQETETESESETESEKVSENETELETVSESEAESDKVSEIETESEQETETESESKTESERETETVSESETTSGKISENETASEIEKEAEDGIVVETGNFLYGEVGAEEVSEKNDSMDIETFSESEMDSSEDNLSEETPAGSESVSADDNETELESQTTSEETEPAKTEENSSEETSKSETESESKEIATEDSTVFENESESAKYKKTAVNKQMEKEQTNSEVTFGSFDANAWCTASDGWKIYEGAGSNMWAPDIIYNTSLKKYCMYLSLNGEYHNSVIILLTADNLEGPYAYQGPVLYSGFTAQENVPTNYQNTDMKYIFGESELLERYQKISGITLDSNGKITNVGENKWGDFWPHAIDPAVFYDEDGNLWMIYGSWSGGIYALELDETTGLRDYTVTYASDYDSKKQSVTSDPYFGKKIAGGYYVSGEGPYIEKIGNYYYLFMSYGFYAPNGGYSMRIFRSENPDGPYVDTKGTSAIYDKFSPNFIADYAKDVNQIDTRGMRLLTYYQWDHMPRVKWHRDIIPRLQTVTGHM